MLTKNLIKYIKSLSNKKNRDRDKVFVAEGNKLIGDLLGTLNCKYLIATNNFIKTIDIKYIEQLIEVKDDDLKKVTFLKNPQQSFAVFEQTKHPSKIDIKDKLTIVLDEVQDPGNLGTIIRLADWYGIENIFCSPNSADVYNPKTVQATMGALGRVAVHYVDLISFFEDNNGCPIYGTFLDGDNIYEQKLSENGIIVMGNEGNGVSNEVEHFINQRLFIPPYPANNKTSESLNVSIATAIVCAEFRRRLL